MPFKKGLYTPLFKRSEHETDEEYVKTVRKHILYCVVWDYTQAVMKQFEKTLKSMWIKKYSDCIDNQLLELMKRDLEMMR